MFGACVALLLFCCSVVLAGVLYVSFHPLTSYCRRPSMLCVFFQTKQALTVPVLHRGFWA